MIALPYDYFLIAWFVLAGASTAYVAIDQFRNNPEPTVMKWGFILLTLYMGPFGLLLYVLADKEPRPGEHEEFTSPIWKQGVGSTVHCLAGDATGIILAATVTALLGLPMWIDLIVEYVAGFAFGLFIFQSLFMKKMMGGTYWENVQRSFMPEFISMNAMMAGMAPTMSLLMMGRDMRAMDPLELIFWGVMSLGVIVGFGAAYPFNVWMVKNTPAEAMKDMAAVSPRQFRYKAPADARGDKVLEPRLENGVKVFDIEASIIRWNILPDVSVEAYAYNHQVPGPRLQLTEGDHVRINFHNNLPESTTVQRHGLIVPNEMDGPAKITQEPVPPAATILMNLPSAKTEPISITAMTIPIGNKYLVFMALSLSRPRIRPRKSKQTLIIRSSFRNG